MKKEKDNSGMIPKVASGGRKLVYRQGSKTDKFLTSVAVGNHHNNHVHGYDRRQGMNLDDYNLQLAMAMSLEQSQPKQQQQDEEGIKKSSSDFIPNHGDHDLDMAKALSLSELSLREQDCVVSRSNNHGTCSSKLECALDSQI